MEWRAYIISFWKQNKKMKKILALGLIGALANSTIVEPCEHTAA